jgi:hypothetical protein
MRWPKRPGSSAKTTGVARQGRDVARCEQVAQGDQSDNPAAANRRAVPRTRLVLHSLKLGAQGEDVVAADAGVDSSRIRSTAWSTEVVLPVTSSSSSVGSVVGSCGQWTSSPSIDRHEGKFPRQSLA